MSTRFANLTSRAAVVIAMLCAIVACGGGGGGGDGGFLPDDGNDGSTYFLALQMLDSSGEPSNTVTSTAPSSLQVKVTRKNKNGKVVPNVVVSASTDIGNVLPDSGTSLSNDNGIARFQIEAGNGKGAGTITAQVNNEDGTVTTATLAFQIGNTGLRLGYFDEDGDFIENEISIEPDGTLAAAGNAQLTVFILDEEGNLVSSSESVRFSSGCLASGGASLAPASPVTSGDGRVATTYTASNCAGVDEISASLVGADAQAFGTVTVAPPSANRMTFVSAEPTLIVLKGTGGGPNRQEFSDVVFRAVDSNNSPLQGIKVDFSLTTFVGGLTVSPTSAISDADGNVKVSVFSGDVATVVRVIATTNAGDGTGAVSTVSDVLSVSTGLPDQNSISLSVDNPIVEGAMEIDNITRRISVNMADKFNNPVPDGTAAIFTTEYGVIQPSCVTVDGTCEVEWASSNPRFPTLDAITESIKTINDPNYNCPSHNGNSGPCPDDLGITRGGRSTILVTAIGEESFIDRNGNGVMDQDERDLFDNVPEAHLDNNEDGIFNPAAPGCEGLTVEEATGACLAGFEEIFTDFNSNAVYDLNDDPAVYNGLLCPREGDGNWCSRELVNVRDDIVLTLSFLTQWDILLVSGSRVVNSVNEGSRVQGLVSDLFNNPPPNGSTVNVSAEGCDLISPSSFPVLNSSSVGAFEFDGIEVAGDGEGGTVTVTLDLKAEGEGNGGQDVYSESFPCTTFAPPDPNDLIVSGGGPAG